MVFIKKQKQQIVKSKLRYLHGFTLVEVLIVVAITMILAAVTVPIYGNLQVSSQLNENTSLLIQNLRTAQERSLARLNSSSHGVKLFPNSYVLYQGSSYVTRVLENDRIIELGDTVNLEWSLVGTGQPNEINLSKSLGVPNMMGDITITHDIGGDDKTVKINSFGKVEEQ